MGQIADNYEKVMQTISLAAKRAGRNIADIRLVAVSKKQSVEKINEAILAGVTILGENYPEEALDKFSAIEGAVEWHMIGHMQSRKAKIIAEHFSAIHSIDSLHTAGKLNQALCKANRSITVLLEVGLAGESQKHGYDLSHPSGMDLLSGEIEQMAKLSQIRLAGIMVMPPYAEDPEASRSYFSQGRDVLDRLQQRFPAMAWKELSMGTSQDFGVAVEEGATFVRVGTAIFGDR